VDRAAGDAVHLHEAPAVVVAALVAQQRAPSRVAQDEQADRAFRVPVLRLGVGHLRRAEAEPGPVTSRNDTGGPLSTVVDTAAQVCSGGAAK
jgi:hypothetical protein